MTSEFKGLTAAVTGAGSGIGLATLKILADGGATVFGLDIAEGGIAEHGTWLQCDVGDDASVAAAFSKISSLDILINSAAISAVGTVEANPSEEWAKVMNVSKCASITNVCSVAATAGIPKRALYSATKGAVLSLTMAMANDHIVDGVRVNCVNPGTADTPWVQRLLAQSADPAAERKALEARQPLGRLVSAEEVARALCYLASPLQGSTTAASLTVDGGMQGLRIPK